MRKRAALCLTALLALLLFPACGPTTDVVRLEAQSDYVNLAVQAMDSLGRPIEGVQVRIVEAWQEYDGEYYPARGPSRLRTTGPRGRAVFDAYDLGQAQLGFATTFEGDAVLYDIPTEDEAIVTLEIGSSSLGWVEIDLKLSFNRPYNEVILTY